MSLNFNRLSESARQGEYFVFAHELETNEVIPQAPTNKLALQGLIDPVTPRAYVSSDIKKLIALALAEDADGKSIPSGDLVDRELYVYIPAGEHESYVPPADRDGLAHALNIGWSRTRVPVLLAGKIRTSKVVKTIKFPLGDLELTYPIISFSWTA